MAACASEALRACAWARTACSSSLLGRCGPAASREGVRDSVPADDRPWPARAVERINEVADMIK